ncbi:MAG: ribosomal RNA small subunit methyltransferase A [Planctomycetaceae bacterium]|nr:ribosomal RNA small subunit methyltransferase A [Planctomycetaceae bacterium]
MSDKQTVSYLIQRFREVGIRPDTRHGQNFLVDLNLIELLARTAQVDARDVVLEVGTGTGSLTSLVAPHAAAVVTVEIDAALHQLAQESLVQYDNICLLHLDALKNKNRLAPEVLKAVGDALAGGPARRFKLVANLPYNIATPVVSNLLSTDIVPVSMTITIQKELADRFTAKPGTKDYGALSIWIQCQCEVEIIRVMPPSSFWPRPKVHSAIVHIEPKLQMRERIPDLEGFHWFVRSMFFHRRKFLRSVLLSAHKKEMSKPMADAVLERMQLGPDARAEQLSVKEMLRLFQTVQTELDS